MNHIKSISLALLCATLTGCSSVPMASASLDSEGKTFTPPPGKANIYVYRSGGIGGTVIFHTILDGKSIGSIAAGTYQLLTVSPGDHSVTLNSNENSKQHTITAEAGQNYFINVNVAIGWTTGRVKIRQGDEDEGRKAVSKLKRAETTNYQ